MMPAEIDTLRAFAEAYTAAWCGTDPSPTAAHRAPRGV
jgi:hypothetical protein